MRQPVHHIACKLLHLEGVGKPCSTKECPRQARHSVEVVVIELGMVVELPMCQECALLAIMP